MVQGPRMPLKPLKTRSKTYGMLDQLTGQACLTTSQATGTGLKKDACANRLEKNEVPPINCGITAWSLQTGYG